MSQQHPQQQVAIPKLNFCQRLVTGDNASHNRLQDFLVQHGESKARNKEELALKLAKLFVKNPDTDKDLIQMHPDFGIFKNYFDETAVAMPITLPSNTHTHSNDCGCNHSNDNGNAGIGQIAMDMKFSKLSDQLAQQREQMLLNAQQTQVVPQRTTTNELFPYMIFFGTIGLFGLIYTNSNK